MVSRGATGVIMGSRPMGLPRDSSEQRPAEEEQTGE